MPAELEDVPLRYLLGVLAMPFTPLWEAGKQVLLIHANAHHAMYWATMWEYVLHTSKALTSVQEDEIRTKQQAVATEGSDDRRCFAALMAVSKSDISARFSGFRMAPKPLNRLRCGLHPSTLRSRCWAPNMSRSRIAKLNPIPCHD